MRQTQKDAIAMFNRDLREIGRRPAPQSSAGVPDFGELPARQRRARPYSEDPESE